MRVTEFAITNFRSLKDFGVAGLGPLNVLYGENDVGKSNILAALQMIFSAKWRRTDGDYRSGRFHEGEVRHFGDNFSSNTQGSITFNVHVALDDNEITSNLSPAGTRLDAPRLATAPLAISGVIDKPRIVTPAPPSAFLPTRKKAPAKPPETIADFRVTLVKWHDIAVFDRDAEGDNVLPGQAHGFFGIGPEKYTEFFNLLTEYLTDSFQLVPPTRFYGQERVRQADTFLRPGNFKNALLQWSQGLPDRGRIQTFRGIQRWFDSKPFSYGQISPFVIPLGPQDSMADIMVTREDRGLPIERYGTGVQQVLILLSYLLSDRKRRMLGVEEMELNLSPNTQDRTLDQFRTAMEDPAFQLDQLFLTSHSEVFATKCRGRCFLLGMQNGCTVVTPAALAPAGMAAHFAAADRGCCDCSTPALTKEGEKYRSAPVDWNGIPVAEHERIMKACAAMFCDNGCDGKIETARMLAERQGLKLPW